MSYENVSRVRQAYEALGRADPGPLIALMDVDIEWIEPDGAPGVGQLAPGSGVYLGRDDVVARILARIPEIWADFAVHPQDYLDAGDHVVVLGQLTATVPGTGAPAGAPFAHVWRFAGDKAVWWRCYEDTAMLHHARGTF